MKIPLTFEDLTVGLKVIENDSQYEGTVESIQTNRVYLKNGVLFFNVSLSVFYLLNRKIKFFVFDFS